MDQHHTYNSHQSVDQDTNIILYTAIMSASLVSRSRRQLFLSTYSLNSNESSIESTGTPPARRHSNSLLGGEI